MVCCPILVSPTETEPASAKAAIRLPLHRPGRFRSPRYIPRPVTKADCTPLSHEDDLNGKVVVIKPEVLRREYQMATNQIKLCTGGFGAPPHSRGSACFCVDLYSGKEARFERQDILGTLKSEQLPQWAALWLEQYQNQHRQKSHKGREER